MGRCHGVMIVEDDNDLRETLASALEFEGVSVFSAANGREALDSLKKLNTVPCLILLDLMMPIMNGWEFLAERRQEEKLSHIPVVVVSAFSKESPSGIERVIGKPINLDVLINVAKEFCAAEAA